ncbi:hypothetical protein CKA32_005458 [Geitlerinema sp. FC II]|nr:hypothetical protein [Geitlerinema sp. CS-897]PPT08593.1 hypothetical protein CKA32_005458 [Geitlerinema sp. FC II]
MTQASGIERSRTMTPKTSLPQLSLTQIVERIFAFRQITPIDRQLLHRAVLDRKSLTPAEYQLIQQLQDALHRGKIWIADESSRS